MDSEEESASEEAEVESASEEAEVESEEDSDSGVASLALATAYVAKSIFNTADNDPSPMLMLMTRTTLLPPTASWHVVPRV